MKPGHRARASRGRLSPLTTISLVVLAVTLSAVAGGFAYFLPAAATALQETGVVVNVPSPSPISILFSPSPSPTLVAQEGAFTVLLLGSDDDSKFTSDHVLTQSMILMRVQPATKEVTMLSIPRDLYVHLSTGGSGKIDGAYSY
jgi:anionic cell wall polymer biosynthesis LytR-Cps2A-Psr (LCP) family protein